MNLLKQREQTHGDYGLVASVSQALKEALRIGPFDELPAIHRESLEMICVKMARVVCGDHYALDHFIDVKGYSQLVLDFITDKRNVPSGSAIQEPDDDPQDASIGDDWDYNPYNPRSGIPR